MRYHADDRGQRYCDIFPKVGVGDINVTVVEPGATALWHRHQFQSDYQFVIKGALKIGMCNLPNLGYSAVDMKSEQVVKTDNLMDKMLNDWKDKYHDIVNVPSTGVPWSYTTPTVEWHYLSERNANEGPLYIPPGLWHGCHNYTNEQAILIYHITNKYDGTDEDRCSVEDMMWPVEREAK